MTITHLFVPRVDSISANMTDPKSKTPWKNGYWINERVNVMIFIVNGEKMDGKQLVALDYPDIEEGGWKCTIKYGDFGPARKEIADAANCGEEAKNNIEIDFSGIYKAWLPDGIDGYIQIFKFYVFSPSAPGMWDYGSTTLCSKS